MKNFFMLLCGLLAWNLAAAVALPEKWDVEFFKIDEKTFLKGLNIGSAAQKLTLSDKAINLDTIANGKDSAAIRGFIDVDKAQTVWLGIGSKLFSLYLNGKMIYDFREYALGYDILHVKSTDHIVPLELKAGRNEILFNTRRTNWKYDYCYGKNRKIIWDLAVELMKDYQPVKAALAHPEMALRPDRDSVMFSFVTTEAIPAGVDYRKKGDKEWLREYDTTGELVLRERSRIHRVRISGIANWGDIEYRLVLLEPPAGQDGLRRPCRSPRTYKEVFTPVKTLHNPDKDNFSFLLFGDTQLSLSKSCQTVAQRRELLNKLRTFPEYKAADFLVHIGDTDSYIHNVEKYLLTDLFNDFAPAAGEKLRPWLLVRSNHDTNGIAAEEWYDHFQMPDEKSYFSFQLGKVFFIVLDCGEYFSSGKLNAFNGPLLDMKKLMRKQAQWLKQVRRSEAFRNAAFRVVIAHGEVQISRSKFNNTIRELALDMLQDKSESGKIHLWVAGHCHRYWRAAEGSRSLVTRIEPKAPPALPVSPVNWLTGDAPKGSSAKPDFSYIHVSCSPEKLLVKAIDENGKKFDEFVIDRNGKLTELYLDKELKAYPLPVAKDK
ncbi:MAG: metallophosphoesterase [Lentisphaeria bacterium]|nr:metallophosphoesterase [Lentisphaeria bacterium]